MPSKPPSGETPQLRPTSAAKKPSAPGKAKTMDKEARLAEALRENLRRRKAGSGTENKKDD